MYSGNSDGNGGEISGISSVENTNNDGSSLNSTSLPSIHFKGDDTAARGADADESGDNAERSYSLERDGVPRVSKSGIHLSGSSGHYIRFSSPRTKKALLQTGIQPGQLQPRPRDDFALGAKLPAVVDRRFEAFEELRTRHLQLVLDARGQLPREKKAAKEDGRRGDDTATLLKMEAALKARILKAAETRMKEEERSKIA